MEQYLWDDTSTEVGGSSHIAKIIKWICEITERINEFDTTWLSPSMFRIVNSIVLPLLEYQDMHLNQRMDQTYRQGINILHELFTHPDESILFLPVEKWQKKKETIDTLISEWVNYFNIYHRENPPKYSNALEIRYIDGLFEFILIRVGDIEE